jgi:hypothetical protein
VYHVGFTVISGGVVILYGVGVNSPVFCEVGTEVLIFVSVACFRMLQRFIQWTKYTKGKSFNKL